MSFRRKYLIVTGLACSILGFLVLWFSDSPQIQSLAVDFQHTHLGSVTAISCHESTGIVVSGDEWGQCVISHLQKPKRSSAHYFKSAGIDSIAISDTGKFVAVAWDEMHERERIGLRGVSVSSSKIAQPTTCRILRTDTAKEVAVLKTADPIVALSFCPETNRLAAGTRFAIYLWELSPLCLLAKLDNIGASPGTGSSLQFSPHGDFLAVGTINGEVLFLHPQTLVILNRWTANKSMITSIAISGNQSSLATVSILGEVATWSLPAFRRLNQTTVKDGPVRLCYSPDGSVLAAGYRFQQLSGAVAAELQLFAATDLTSIHQHTFWDDGGVSSLCFVSNSQLAVGFAESSRIVFYNWKIP